MSAFILFENESSNGDSDLFSADGGGTAHVRIYGTFDGATAQVQVDFKDGNYVPVENGDFTEPGLKLIKFKTGERLKLVLSGVGTTDISADVLA